MFNPMQRVMLWQVGMVGVASLASAVYGGIVMALAVLYGGAIAIVNLILLFWRWYSGAKNYHCDAPMHLKGFYRSSQERFIVVGILLALGFVLIQSGALAMLAGFLIGQLAGMTAGLALRERT
jgi:F0F1-type ATP synthase assembly protein I